MEKSEYLLHDANDGGPLPSTPVGDGFAVTPTPIGTVVSGGAVPVTAGTVVRLGQLAGDLSKPPATESLRG
jgi:hypothetical protein